MKLAVFHEHVHFREIHVFMNFSAFELFHFWRFLNIYQYVSMQTSDKIKKKTVTDKLASGWDRFGSLGTPANFDEFRAVASLNSIHTARSAALIDCIVINGSIHTESSAAQRCAASRIKFEKRAAIRAAKCRAALRSLCKSRVPWILIIARIWLAYDDGYRRQKVNRSSKETWYIVYFDGEIIQTPIWKKRHGEKLPPSLVWLIRMEVWWHYYIFGMFRKFVL